jgi:hypothetical protein
LNSFKQFTAFGTLLENNSKQLLKFIMQLLLGLYLGLWNDQTEANLYCRESKLKVLMFLPVPIVTGDVRQNGSYQEITAVAKTQAIEATIHRTGFYGITSDKMISDWTTT